MADFRPVEDVFDAKLLEGVEKEDRPPEPLPFDKIPTIFTGLEEWPQSTNLWCWSCGRSFDTTPWFVPTFVREGAGAQHSVELGVEGNFCTPNCAARHIDTTYPSQAFPIKHWRRHTHLCMEYYLITGQRMTRIAPAPSRTERREFGGPLTEDEFWARLRALDPRTRARNTQPGPAPPEQRVLTVWDVCAPAPPAADCRDDDFVKWYEGLPD